MKLDIKNKIKTLFKTNSIEAINLIESFEVKNSFNPRVSRCVVYLSKGCLSCLKENIIKAEEDWRDVIVEAEEDCFDSTAPFE